MILSLPQELVDETIAFLRDDNASLASCTRACRALLPAASSHLFRIISFSRGLKVPPNVKLLEFKQALETTPRLRNNIREVRLAPTLFARRTIARYGEGFQECFVDPLLLGDTLALLDHLSAVDIGSCHIQSPQDGQQIRPLPHTRLENVVLGTLYATSDSRGTTSRLRHMLALFANTTVERLEIYGQWSGAPREPSPLQLRVSRLVFHERSAEATPFCFETLRSCLAPQTLTALHVSLFTMASLQLVCLDALITRVGINIRTLQLDLLGMTSWNSDTPDVLPSLRICTQLRSLHLSLVICSQAHLPLSLALLTFLRHILTCASRSVCSVVLAVYKCFRCPTPCADQENSLSCIPWQAVRDALDLCAGLESVMLEVEPDWELECPESYVQLQELFADIGIIKRARGFSVAC